MSSVVQIPSRSGCPHALRGAFQCGFTRLAAAASADPLASPTTTQWHAVYFDSPRSLTPKLALADERGLAGAGFWAIGYERGLPGYHELIKTFAAGTLEAPPG